MLDDRFWLQKQDFFGQRVLVPTANNGDFVANAIEVLAGGDDLVGLRSRGTSARPFEVVERIQREAQARYSAEERALQAKLKDTQAKLESLTGKDQSSAPTTLSAEQTKAIEEFRADMVQTRRQLRDVQGGAAQRHQPTENRARIFRHRADPDHRRRGRHRPRRIAAEAPHRRAAERDLYAIWRRNRQCRNEL